MLKSVELCVAASGPKVQSAATACMLVTATVATCCCQGYPQHIVKIGFVLTLFKKTSASCVVVGGQSNI